MNNRKTQNSLLVLATLGVYFGLVLAGATPQLLAQQAAMTKEFSVKDEVEVKDDLDKKPNPTSEELDDAIETYFNDLIGFIQNLKKLNSIEKFDSEYDTFSTSKVSFAPCPETGILQSKETNSHIDRWLVPAIEVANFAAENSTWMGDCLPFDGFTNRTKAKSAGIVLSYDKTELTYQISLNLKSGERAKSLHHRLLDAVQRFNIDTEDTEVALTRVLYENTKLTQTKNQVFIITHLPRAGLDSLLAKDAK